MANEHSEHASTPPPTPRPFSASVRPNLDGGWLAEVNLGDGATLTKWFPSEAEASRYPEELVEWLSRDRGD